MVVVYSSSLHLDILPRWANKGNALRWLIRHLKIRADHILRPVRGNDLAMFLIDQVKGIVVGQRPAGTAPGHQAPALYHAAAPCARGVVEGLSHYQVFPAGAKLPETETDTRARFPFCSITAGQNDRSATRRPSSDWPTGGRWRRCAGT